MHMNHLMEVEEDDNLGLTAWSCLTAEMATCARLLLVL